MYTVCPKCALTLVVTAADLRVAQGFVRCGRCSNVFNALARLSEERSTVATGVASPTLSQPAPPPPPQEPEPAAPAPSATERKPAQDLAETDSIPDSALEFNPEATDVSKVFIEQTPDPQWSAATGKFKALFRKSLTRTAASAPSQAQLSQSPASQPSTSQPSTSQPSAAQRPASAAPAPAAPPAATPQTIPTDEDAQFDIEVDAEFLAATTQLRPQPPAPPAAPAASATEASPAPAAPVAATGAPGSAVPQGAAAKQPHPAPEPPQDVGFASPAIAIAAGPPADEIGETPARAHPRPALGHLWSVGAAVLVILLAGQIVNHYRHDLATHERFYGPLTRLYAALGIPLVPRWNLGAYDVRQLGASADNTNAGQITVRASVKNTAKQPQPLPLLRVTLQDRFGNRIAARDVPPKSYLPAAIPSSSFLSAGQRVDAEMAFVDPGSNAVGFEIDACLPEPGGAIACANDSSTR